MSKIVSKRPQRPATFWGCWQKAHQSLTPPVDWLDCLTDPGGLLSVVPKHFAVPVFYGWDSEK
jgi:hypothetical protein